MVADIAPETLDQTPPEDTTPPLAVADPPLEADADEGPWLSRADALRQTALFNLDCLSTEALISLIALGAWTLLGADDDPPALLASDDDLEALERAVQVLAVLHAAFDADDSREPDGADFDAPPGEADDETETDEPEAETDAG